MVVCMPLWNPLGTVAVLWRLTQEAVLLSPLLSDLVLVVVETSERPVLDEQVTASGAPLLQLLL